jgi:hypothetical protein
MSPDIDQSQKRKYHIHHLRILPFGLHLFRPTMVRILSSSLWFKNDARTHSYTLIRTCFWTDEMFLNLGHFHRGQRFLHQQPPELFRGPAPEPREPAHGVHDRPACGVSGPAKAALPELALHQSAGEVLNLKGPRHGNCARMLPRMSRHVMGKVLHPFKKACRVPPSPSKPLQADQFHSTFSK